MALAKDHMGSVQTRAYSGNLMGDFPSLAPNGFGENNSGLLIKNLTTAQSSSSSLGSPSSANSNEFVFQATSNEAEKAQSLINFNGRCKSLVQSNGPLLSFQPKNKAPPQSIHGDYYSNWECDLINSNNQMNPKCSTDPRLLENLNCFQTASNCNSIMSDPAERESSGEWLYHEATPLADSIQDPESHDTSFHKRPNSGESMQAPIKKQCSSNATATRKSKQKSSAPPKDPQSVAAKIRRERISERLKILQELVPNGSKVDLVTMLEKAISYVKFLQLQVKVLATDEFWPAQGGKAPDISQVKEAIDAILSSQRDRKSSSSSR